MSAAVEVIVAGLLTTVQDEGRWGHQAAAVPVAGAMDPFAHRLANALVGNRRDAATLECTLTGPSLRFHEARRVAVTGAIFELFLDQRPIGRDMPLEVSRGAVLRFGRRLAGARAYVSVSGGFDTPVVFGSRATHLPTGVGGWRGRALKRGDLLPLGPADDMVRPVHLEASMLALSPDSPGVVRILPGPDDDRFTPGALDTLASAPYLVGADSNRMGYRLEGPALAHAAGADLVSDVTPLGTLQVPASGQPVLLMADRQTTGGYTRLGTVITADIGIAAQVPPGDRLAFRVCTHVDAVAALVARERPLLAIEVA